MAERQASRTPGELLRDARERRGATLDAAEEGTKIPRRLLEAIEHDEYHKLSGPLYVKSFLRTYATWLQLAPDEVLRVYELATGRPGAASPSGEMVWSEDQVEVTRIGIPWRRYLLMGAGTVAALALLVWIATLVFGRGETTPRLESGGRVEPVAEAAAGGSAPALPGARPDRAERDSAATPPVTSAPAGPANGDPAAAELPLPARGDSALRFAGGATYPLVLRVLLPAPTNCLVRRDGDGAGIPLIWPGTATPPPAYNVKQGVAYAVRGGFAAYWGAEDNFTLILDDLQGAQVTLNGIAQPVERWRQGQPVVLDRFTLGPGGG
ncbi:MAG TPA: helix-turn-helix domain-containing protein [Candidatus Krumholzibacteria bacterium]|nr:helix-turn-helix domain-containing protein [Candidatus Krumholzibacteria bacterium]HPD72809.1 helix-turn-helix domain-containing protein [Candidatus Krumholzibacteria bacterium]HRY40259.1 helix-turn-helix domain-containing protein [Candidatus Krumholzibacteria bacterium]